MRKSSVFYLQHDVLINNVIAWGIPAIFAIVALSAGDIGYVTSHYCGPTLTTGQALVWIPLLVYISIASLLQIWTLGEIEEVCTYLSTVWSDGRPYERHFMPESQMQLQRSQMTSKDDLPSKMPLHHQFILVHAAKSQTSRKMVSAPKVKLLSTPTQPIRPKLHLCVS
jgi:hypothetical protein